MYSETIQLDDKVSPTAQRAQKALVDLEKSMAKANQQMVKASAIGDQGAFAKAAGDSEKFKGGIQNLNKEFPKLVQNQGEVSKGSKAVSQDMAATAGILEALAAAAAVAVIAFGALIVKGAAFAIEASEAKNASIALFEALGSGVISGEDVDDMLDGLRAKLGITKDTLGKFTTEFLKMGINSEKALESLTTAAVSAEALVKGGGDAFVKMQAQIDAAAESGQKLTIPFKKLTVQLGAMGLNVDDVAKKMGITGTLLTSQLKAGTIDAKKFGDALTDAATTKGAGPLEALANSSANLGAMLKEYIGDLFEDLGPAIAPFMKQVRELFDIFESKTNPSGQALKAGIGGFFKEVFALATRVVPLIKHFLLDVIIYGLKAYIALKPIIAWFKQIAQNQTVIDAFKSALTVIGVALLAVAGAIAIVVGLALVMGAAVSALITGIVWLTSEILSFVASAGSALAGWVASAATAAYDFVAGLVAGIGNGASQVIGAVTGLAGKATGAFKSALGIASPSKVMAGLGGHMTDGVAEGLEGGASDVQQASSSVAGASVKGMSDSSSGAKGGAGTGGGGATINVSVMIDGAGKSALDITEEMVASVMQRVALGAGL